MGEVEGGSPRFDFHQKRKEAGSAERMLAGLQRGDSVQRSDALVALTPPPILRRRRREGPLAASKGALDRHSAPVRRGSPGGLGGIMSRIRRAKSGLLVGACALVTALLWLMALLVWLHGSGAQAADEVLRAGSVCEAQRLKARKALDPRIEIEISPEHDKPFPSLEACESHDDAWDESNPGPRQPIPFSHKHHAGKFEMDCQYCHSGSERSRVAGVPSVEVCMGCHSQFPPEYDQLEGIAILKEHWEKKKPIEWQQIHRLPEHVKFRHNRHMAAGLECQRCHGPVEEMDKLYQTKDTVWWPWAMPAQKLEMGWCISCHRENNHQASQDCLTFHY